MKFLRQENDTDEDLIASIEQVRKQLDSKVKIQSVVTIGSWSPLTTHLLDTGGYGSWNYMDNAISIPNNNFVQCFVQEWDDAKLGEKFPPGCTNGDPNASEIMDLTVSKFGSGEHSSEESSDKDTTTSTISQGTGDKSIFIPSEFRSSADFQKQLPCLALLLKTIQNTVEKYLTEYFTFDYDLTTIQVEIYPGDGKSGYIRDYSKSGSTKKKKGNSKRMKDIVTFTYFATPEDWDLQQHGGCLRILSSASTTSTSDNKKPALVNKHQQNQQQQQYFDIPPFSNRLFVFRCDSTAGIVHQLLPSKRPRMAISVWYHGYNKKDEAQMERDFVFIDCKTGSIGSVSRDTLVDAGVITLSDVRGTIGGYTITEVATKHDEKTKLITMVKDCEKLGLGMGTPKEKATGFSGEEAQLVAAKWGIALKKRVKNKEGEELLFLDPNMNTIGEISRTKCVSANIITISTDDVSKEETIKEAEIDPAARGELLEIVKEMMYTLEFEKHVDQNY